MLRYYNKFAKSCVYSGNLRISLLNSQYANNTKDKYFTKLKLLSKI